MELYKRVEKILKDFEFKYEIKDDYFYVNTKTGWWRIRPEHKKGSKIVTIFTRFENPELINKDSLRWFNFNAFSGKLNFHMLTKNREELLNSFKFLCEIVADTITCR